MSRPIPYKGHTIEVHPFRILKNTVGPCGMGVIAYIDGKQCPFPWWQEATAEKDAKAIIDRELGRKA